MLETTELVVSGCYFRLFYHDKDLRIPEIKTLIYIGKNLHSEGETSAKEFWFFQDPESFLKYGPADKKPVRSECEVHRLDSEALFSICDWTGLIEELSENKEAQDRGEIFN